LNLPIAIGQMHYEHVYSWSKLISHIDQIISSVVIVISSFKISSTVYNQSHTKSNSRIKPTEFREVIVKDVFIVDPVLLISEPNPGKDFHFGDKLRLDTGASISSGVNRTNRYIELPISVKDPGVQMNVLQVDFGLGQQEVK
ncbi:MAG: hypothetical protein FJY85_13585, partial [Deltaproteobacteria bacterium]|nr:hypothetical protein [Deltaproteobacteria bacterium]